MLDANFVLNAKMFAAGAHAGVGQLRKYTLDVYANHVIEVAITVARFTDDPEVVAAALLHDVVEDTSVTLDQVRRIFGDRVADLVDMLTDVSKPSDGNRVVRKALDLQHTALSCPDAQTIKLADMKSNILSIVQHDPSFARGAFLREMDSLLKVLVDGNATLYGEVSQLLKESRQTLFPEG